MAKEEFPEIKKENEGKFTAWVQKNMPGMDTCKAASKIMRSRTKKYSPAVVKMANYANNFGCKTKKEDGASMGSLHKAQKDFMKNQMKEFKAKQNAKKAKLKASRSASDGSSYSMSESPKSTTAAERRKAAQDRAMGDNTTNKKGLGRAIEKYKDRNDVVSYTYENEKGGTTGVTTTKKKVRKEQRQIERSNPKSNTKPTKGSKAQKITKVKYKKPKNAKYGIQKGRVNKQRMRKK